MSLRSVVFSVVGLVVAAPAVASVVVPTASSELCYGYGRYQGCDSWSDAIARSLAWDQGGAAVAGSPVPVASAEARYKWNFRASYQYYFTVDGASAGVIPLLAYYRLLAASQGNARASAKIVVEGVTQSLDTATDPALVRYQSVSGVLQTSILGGSVGSVTLQAFADTWLIDPYYGGSATAFADPYIIIDPAYAAIDPDYASKLTLRFSEGVVNAAAPGVVPEPASWGMMIAGFAGVGAALRRRRAVSFSS